LIVLLLGVGAQGQAALYDLAQSANIEKIIAADLRLEPLTAFVEERNFISKVSCVEADVTNPEQLESLFARQPTVVVDLLPVDLHIPVIEAALKYRVHLVNTSYIPKTDFDLDSRATEKGVSLLPEFGMDPGIDLVMMSEAVRPFDSVERLVSYGAGFPEPAAASNPLKYKITWTFEGVLRSYRRPGRMIVDGELIEVDENEMFSPQYYHNLEIENLGVLEAFPNGDATKYAEMLEIDPGRLRNLGRYVLRWPGHCEFWKKMVDLHLLDDTPVEVEGVPVDRIKYLANALGPHLQYDEAERDVVVVRVEVAGRKDGAEARNILQLIDRRDSATGLSAMNRTVGFSASIGAQLLGNGVISRRGLLSPLRDVPFELFRSELQKRGMRITSENSWSN
jgi:saccharopine dehydrogenase-like NADP-dependent oxidoreductase